MTAIQYWLRCGGSLEELHDKYAIKSHRHRYYPNLVELTYNQIASPFSEQIVQECRGIILDEANNWNVVCRSFDKFFNLGEQYAANINWATAEVQEKLDGTLIQMYWYDGHWEVATKGSPDASSQVHFLQTKLDCAYKYLFWNIFGTKGFKLPKWTYCTYTFELTAPENRIVVLHKEANLTLIGIRDNEDGREFSPKQLDYLYPTPQLFSFKNEKECLESFADKDPLKLEGYVVCSPNFTNFNRIKIKHPGYVQAHLANGKPLTRNRILDIIRRGETSEVLAAMPELTVLSNELRQKYESLVAKIEVDYKKIGDIQNQKEFAAQANQTTYPSALFLLKAGKEHSVKEILVKMSIDKLASLI